MARTVQDCITRAREILQDAAGVRYTDPELLSHFVSAIDQARSVRPDMFIGSYTLPSVDTVALADPFPLPNQLFNAVAYFISGNAELRDDEFAVDGRAMNLKETLTKKLVSGM